MGLLPEITKIPKIIHSAWFGRGEKRDIYKRCMATWREKLPTWQFVEWNEDNLDFDCPYVKHTLERREFVKPTELARLLGLWRLGGIYLDCDVEVLRDLSDFLEHDMFISTEDGHYINGAVMGATRGNPIVGRLIEAFPHGTYGTAEANTYGPLFLTQALQQHAKDDGLSIFPPKVFFPWYVGEKTNYHRAAEIGSYCAHHWEAGWTKGPL